MQAARFRKAFILLILLYVALSCALILSIRQASAQSLEFPPPLSLPHDMHDPAHWYPSECCSQKDCYPLAEGDVKETPDGYLIQSTGELIPFGTERESGDGKFHRCSSAGDKSKPTLTKNGRICLFRPNAGT